MGVPDVPWDPDWQVSGSCGCVALIPPGQPAELGQAGPPPCSWQSPAPAVCGFLPRAAGPTPSRCGVSRVRICSDFSKLFSETLPLAVRVHPPLQAGETGVSYPAAEERGPVEGDTSPSVPPQRPAEAGLPPISLSCASRPQSCRDVCISAGT